MNGRDVLFALVLAIFVVVLLVLFTSVGHAGTDWGMHAGGDWH